MNTVTVKNLLRVLLDTNILISAVVFGGKPDEVLSLALEGKFVVVISPILSVELLDVVNKKFPLSKNDFRLLERQLKSTFEIVNPTESIDILKDTADNRVLEAAIEGKCDYIVTGDKELLRLKVFEGVKIVTAERFLDELKIED